MYTPFTNSGLSRMLHFIHEEMTIMRVLRNQKNKEQCLRDIAQEDFSRRTVSFYKYVRIADAQEVRDALFVSLQALGCKGRVYVAQEGINAQMNVPEPQWDAFNAFIQSIPEFAGMPYKIAREETAQVSFWKLTIKVKDKIVADGIDDATFDPSDTGKYMTAVEVNAAVENPDVLVVDMRNRYEAEVGHFTGAHIMQVDTFREQLSAVKKELGTQKERQVLMYCTGGIRCEKASAWFKHQGFSDVSHIKGGIIDYDRQVKEQNIENKFKGKNFVFDARLGERISDDIVATCHLCDDVRADDHYNCKNVACHVLFIACQSCLDTKKGYCTYSCMFYDQIPEFLKKRITRIKNAYRRKKYQPVFRKGRLHKA